MELDPHAVAAADRIRVVLAEVKVSGSELARRMGVSQSYVARRMTGRQSFTVAELLRIADLLGVPVAQLLPLAASAAA